MKTPNIERSKYLRMLIYGKPGSGKTTLCGSFGLDDRTAPVLHIDLGGNFEVLAKLNRPQIKVLQPDTLDELNGIYDWLEQGQPPIDSKLGLVSGYKTVIFDGFTDVQRQSFDMAMATTKFKFAANYPRREFSHYYFVLQQLLHMVNDLRKLNIHVVITTLEHTKNKYDVAGDATTVYEYCAPLLDGESKREVPGYMLSVLRMQASPATLDRSLPKRLNAQYTVGSFKHDKYQYGKDQYGFNLVECGDPTITKLLDSVKE